MTDAFIFDAVRTPRGRGKPDGSLHEVAPVELAATPLRALDAATELVTGEAALLNLALRGLPRRASQSAPRSA